MTPEESYNDAVTACKRRYALRVYNLMKKKGKSEWWQSEGQKNSYYRRFIGEKNFNELIEYFREFN